MNKSHYDGFVFPTETAELMTSAVARGVVIGLSRSGGRGRDSEKVCHYKVNTLFLFKVVHADIRARIYLN